MKKFMVAVRDSAVNAFAQPMAVPTLGVAIRSFGDEVKRKDPQNALAQHPEDYELWFLAYYEEENGSFESPDEGVRCIARGKDYVEK